jgi:hypothetical protein
VRIVLIHLEPECRRPGGGEHEHNRDLVHVDNCHDAGCHDAGQTGAP